MSETKKIRVEYNRERCIGAKKCMENASDYFSFDKGKAVLNHAKLQHGEWQLESNVTEDQLSSLQKASESCPVNAIGIIDEHGKAIVSKEVKKDTKEFRDIKAQYDDLKEFVMDKKGYFLIRVNQEAKEIEVAFCPELNKITIKIVGKKPLEIYQTVLKEGLISRMDHAAYLGRELQKAYIALEKNIPYVQDDELAVE